MYNIHKCITTRSIRKEKNMRLNCAVSIEERVSKKSGGKYWVMVTTFENGYQITTFLNQDQVFILSGLRK